MAQVHGVPGEWARIKGMALGLWPLFVGVFATGFALALACFHSLAVGGLLSVFAIAFSGWSCVKGLRHVERFYKGARGEEKVSGILSRLPSRYHVFNDFLAGNVHVDHVVVGPAGVFSVETKNWRGEVTVEEGHILVDGGLPTRDPLAQARGEAAQVRTRLKELGMDATVTPVLAFASDNFVAHIAQVGDAVVINSCDLGKSFETEQVVMPAADLERLVRLMENN